MAILMAGSLSGCLAWHRGPLPGEPANATFKMVDGTRVHYIEKGRGPAVVLLHGFGSGAHIWEGLAGELSRTNRVIAVDLKGFGWTDRPPGDYSPHAQAQMVYHLLDELGVGDTAIVAHSWGSSVALEMALQQPKRVNRIALYAAWVYEEQLPPTMLWARAPGMGEVLYGVWYGERMEDKLALAFYDPRFITQDVVDTVEARMKQPGTKAAALAAVRGQRFKAVQRRYPEIDVPVLLIWGEQDRVSKPSFGERLASELPNARLVTHPHCGHFPMIEAAAQSNREVAAFLREPKVSWWKRIGRRIAR